MSSFFIICPACNYREHTSNYSAYADARFKRRSCPACGKYIKMKAQRVTGKKTNSKCDEHCKNAISLICHCECEGKNHGVNWRK